MIGTITRCTDLLKHFASSAVTFATADNSIAATGIGTAFPTAGKKIYISGAAQAGNNGTFTIVSSTANKIIVSETVTAESAGASAVIEEEWQSGYKQAFNDQKLVGTISASQDCTIYLDFSDSKNASSPDYTVTIAVSGGVGAAIDQTILAHYVQMRVRNGGTDQTSMAIHLNGLS